MSTLKDILQQIDRETPDAQINDGATTWDAHNLIEAIEDAETIEATFDGHSIHFIAHHGPNAGQQIFPPAYYVTVSAEPPTPTRWQDLIVWPAGCAGCDIVAHADESLGTLEDALNDGHADEFGIIEKDGAACPYANLLLAAPGEVPQVDTPLAPVNWELFNFALTNARAVAAGEDTDVIPDAAQHTPGPWQVDSIWPDASKGHDFDPVVCITADYDGATIRLADIPDVLSVETQEYANARLIAAAPEMLRALQAIEAILDGRQPKDVPGAVMVARHGIATALGITMAEYNKAVQS